MGSLKGEAKRVLARYRIRLRKGWGQNLLLDEEILQRIVDGAGLRKGDTVLEIGPGIGTLTRRLADEAGRVVAVEIDPLLVKALREELKVYDNIEIIHGDILGLDIGSLVPKRAKVVANLPYNIATRVITHLLNEPERFTTLVLMLQREVAERILAQPGERIFGSFTLFVLYHTIPELITWVAKGSFFPTPKVDGAVIKLSTLPTPLVEVKSKEVLFDVIRGGFSTRRKLLLNALSLSFGIEKERVRSLLTRAGIPPSKRAEEISLQGFARLADLFLEEGIFG